MRTRSTQTTTIGSNIAFSSFGEMEISEPPMLFWQTTKKLSEFSYPFFRVQAQPEIPKLPTQNSRASLELSFEETPKFGIMRKFADTRLQRLPSFSYNEEDVLNWDVVITPPPRPSSIIRVKLKFKGRRKPMPIENPWEE